MILDVVEIARQLVRIPSVNPMGQDVSGDTFYEHAVTDFLEQQFQQLDIPCARQQIAPLRENIVARLDGHTPLEAGGRLLMFEVHQDTVPVEGMTIPPWEASLDGDRLYGRGACDVKGGMASMLAALARLAQERPPEMPTIVLACTVNEECGFTGVRQMVDQWRKGESALASFTSLVPRLPDAVVVAEPTSLDVVVTHKGVVRWRCHTLGRAAHSSCPEKGENAIYHMGRVLLALERFAEQLGQVDGHPLLGRPTISVGTVKGGASVNVVPDDCAIEIDRRLLPNEDPDTALREVVDFLASQIPAAERVMHETPFLVSNGLDDSCGHGLASVLSRIAQRHGCPGNLIGVPYATDAPAFANHNVPTVIFGPGSIAQAHTADEWVSAAELRTAADVYFDLAADGSTGL